MNNSRIWKCNASAISALCGRNKYKLKEESLWELLSQKEKDRVKQAYEKYTPTEQNVPRIELVQNAKRAIQSNKKTKEIIKHHSSRINISSSDITDAVSNICSAREYSTDTNTKEEIVKEAARSVLHCSRGTKLESTTFDRLVEFWKDDYELCNPNSRSVRVWFSADPMSPLEGFSSLEEMKMCEIPGPYYSIVGRTDGFFRDKKDSSSPCGSLCGILEIKNRQRNFFFRTPKYEIDQMCVYMQLWNDCDFCILAEQYNGDVRPCCYRMTKDEASHHWATVLKPLLDEQISRIDAIVSNPDSPEAYSYYNKIL